jgi:uncharacterized protein
LGRIVDCHGHILTPEDAELDTMLRAADRASVERIAISSLSRHWVEFPTAAALDEANADVCAAVEKHPDRFIKTVYLSADEVDTGLAHLDRYIANGPCRTVKLWVSQYADDPRLDPLMDRIIALDVPVLQHTWVKATGNMTKESTWRHCVNRMERHPDLKLWMAHCSGRWEEVARAMAPYPNLCLDVSGGEPEAGVVETLLKHISPERIFYGSDVPGRSFVVQMSKILSAGIPQDWKDMMLGESFMG